MIYTLLITLFSQVIGQACEVTTSNAYLYLLQGSPYPLSLTQFFKGDSMTFTTNSTGALQQYVSGTVGVSTGIPASATIIAMSDNVTPLQQSTKQNVSALVLYNGNYQVYYSESSDNSGFSTWTQVGTSISTNQTVKCTQISYIFVNQIIVSCVQLSNNQQLFYLFQQQINSGVFPLIVQTQQSLANYTNPIYQVMQTKYITSEISLVSAVYSNFDNFSNTSTTQIFIYELNQTQDIISPANITLLNTFSLNSTILGYYMIDQYVSIVLNVGFEPYTPIGYNHTYDIPMTYLQFYDLTYSLTKPIYSVYTGEALAFGVLHLDYYEDYFNILVTYVDPVYAQNIYISARGYDYSVQKGFDVQLPTSFSNTTTLEEIFQDFNYAIIPSIKVQVSAQFVVITDANALMIIPGYTQIGQEHNIVYYTNSTTNSHLNQATFALYDPFSQIVGIFQNGYYATYLIRDPYLVLPSTLVGTGVLAVQANDNVNCTLYINYQTVNTPTIIPLQDTIQNQSMYINDIFTEDLESYFIGPNLTYSVSVTPNNGVSDEVKQFNIYTHPFVKDTNDILFSELVSNELIGQNNFKDEDNQFFYFLQTQANKNKLLIYVCSYSTCQQPQTIFVQYTVQQVVVSGIKTTDENYVGVVFADNPTYINMYQINYKTFTISTKPKVIKISATVPTMIVSQLAIVETVLYIVTQSPQSLQLISLFDLSQAPTIVELSPTTAPRKIFSNNQYQNIVLVDNTLNLGVLQVIDQYGKILYLVDQYYDYQLQTYNQSVGVGMLGAGFYVAETDGITQYLNFYALQAMDPYIKNSKDFTISVPLGGLTIVSPIISSFSDSFFYLPVQSTTDGSYQLAIFQYNFQPLDMLYSSQYLPTIPSSISLTSLKNEISPTFKFDLLQIGYSGAGFTLYQCWNKPFLLFQPAPQAINATTTYTFTYSVSQSGGTPMTLTQNVQASVSKVYQTPITYHSSEYKILKQYRGLLTVDVSNLFNGFISEYAVTGSVYMNKGDNNYELVPLNNTQNSIQPLTIWDGTNNSFDISYNSVATNPQFIYAQNNTGLYSGIVINGYKGGELISNYTNSTFSLCPLVFSYQNSITVSVCQNATDTYLIYNQDVYQSFDNLTGTAYTIEIENGIYSDQQNSFALYNNKSNISLIYLEYNANTSSFQLAYPVQTITIKKLKSYSIYEAFENQGSLYSYGLITLNKDNQVLLNVLERNLTNATDWIPKTYTLTILPEGGYTKLQKVYQYNTSIYTTTAQQLKISLIVLTTKQGYFYNAIINPSLYAFGQIYNAQAQKVFILADFDNLPPQDMLVRQNLVIGIYSNSNQFNTTTANANDTVTPQTVIGIYAIPNISNVPSTKLGFSQFTNFNSLITNPMLTPNGTLIYLIDNLMYIIWCTNNLTIEYDVSEIRNITDNSSLSLINGTNGEVYSELVFQINADTSVASSYVKFQTTFYLPSEVPATPRVTHLGVQLGIGISFFVVIAGVLGYLFYNSRPINID